MKTLLPILILLAACSSKEPEKKPVVYPDESPEVSTTKPKDPSITAKQVAAEQGSEYVVEFKFSKGKTDLTEVNKEKIKEVYGRADRKGQIEEVQLITWADKEFPDKEKESLAPDQVKLVEKRNRSIEAYLSKLDKNLEINKVSMAERAGTVARFTASDEAKVKETLEVKDAPAKVSESMVIFILKN